MEIREDLSENGAFKQRPEGSEGANYEAERTWGGNVLADSQNRKALWLDLQEHRTV